MTDKEKKRIARDRQNSSRGSIFRSSRSNILSLIGLTTVVAVLVVFDLHGIALFAFFFVALPLGMYGILLYLFCRLQLATAGWLTPYFFSRGNFRLVRWFCGQEYSAWALNNYAVKLFEDENYKLAGEAIDHVLCLDERCSYSWSLRGAIRYCVGDYAGAVDDLTSALRISDEHQMALTYRGYALMMMHDFPNALHDFNRVECHLKDHYWVVFHRGHLREQLQQWQAAIDDYLFAYQLDSSQTAAGISLARIQGGCPDGKFRDADKAIENANNMCVRTSWNDWIPISVLGAAYAEAGDFDKATKYAVFALGLAPENEKRERRNRIRQFEDHVPFRITVTTNQTENVPTEDLA